MTARMTSIPTSDFTREFDAETGRLLRHRFFWFIGSVGSVYLLARVGLFAVYGAILVASAAQLADESLLIKQVDKIWFGRVGLWIVLLLTLADLSVMIWATVRMSRRSMRRDELVRFTQNVVMYLGVTHVIVNVLMRVVGFPWIIGLYHLFACVCFPWTPQQAIRPIGPLLLLNAMAVLIFGDFAPGMTAAILILSLFVAAPGIMTAWFKHSRRMDRFRIRALQTRYGQMRRELVDARRIHEALFPPPIQTGSLRFEYRYQPMLQIGGDYLYAKRCVRVGDRGEVEPNAAFNVLVLDVTGHGIAAALTVNRLYGEVERLFAENPGAGPGEVLTALNRYVHLTLATHSVYVTALCVKIDEQNGKLEYASGGHPPAFLCTADGKIEQLDSTAIVLGACAACDFDPCVEARRFEVGDTLLAYTDGAIEARNDAGRMWGVQGMARCLANVHRRELVGKVGLAGVVASAVESHRYGPPEDDTLVVEITRTIPARTDVSAESREGTAPRSVVAGVGAE